ncbi:hypothetical protein CF126_18355 [Aeromonas dhakensis]|nr:hypothetical protein CF131_09855 [Aeromonas dhakensis]TNI49056.1 hypothetical protein CF130_00655 [Aeromonas dhakensis]TNI53332.1 hypothetical protein CF126_18355 [Aeromonas dhakensis]
MKDRKKDLAGRARPVLARGAAGRQQSFTRMEIDTGSAQARRGPDCAPALRRGSQQAAMAHR